MTELEFRQSVVEVKNTARALTDEVGLLRKQTRRNRLIAWGLGFVLAAVSALGGYVYWDDQRDDNEMACAITDAFDQFTEAAVAANPNTNPEVVETFRLDLARRLPPCNEEEL